MTTIRESLLDTLQVNVISITIAALFIVLALAWVETIRAFCAAVLQQDDVDAEDRYDLTWRKTIVSIIVSIIFVFMILAIYTYAISNKIILKK